MDIVFLVENKGVIGSLVESSELKPEDLILKKTLNHPKIRLSTFNIKKIICKNNNIVSLLLHSNPVDRSNHVTELELVYHEEDGLWYPENICIPDTNYTNVIKLKEVLEIFFIYIGYQVESYGSDVCHLKINGNTYDILTFMDMEKSKEVQFQGKHWDMEKELQKRLHITEDSVREEWEHIRERFSKHLFKENVRPEEVEYEINYSEHFKRFFLILDGENVNEKNYRTMTFDFIHAFDIRSSNTKNEKRVEE